MSPEPTPFPLDELEDEWEAAVAEEALAPYLDENGEIDFAKLKADSIPGDQVMRELGIKPEDVGLEDYSHEETLP